MFRDEKKVKKRKKTAKSTLSFALDDDEGDESGNTSQNGDEPPVKRPKSRKNPEVDTSFLPDREREEAERVVGAGCEETGEHKIELDKGRACKSQDIMMSS